MLVTERSRSKKILRFFIVLKRVTFGHRHSPSFNAVIPTERRNRVRVAENKTAHNAQQTKTDFSLSLEMTDKDVKL